MAKSETKGYGKVLVFQNVFICDDSGSGRLVLWEGDVRKVAKGKSYVTGFGKTLRMGFLQKIEFDAWLISSSIELTCVQVLG